MAKVTDNVIQERPNHVKRHHNGHNGKENAVFFIGQQVVQRLPGGQREAQVDGRDAQGAADIQREEPPVGAKIAQEDPER